MKKIIDFLIHGEGIRLKAYADSGGVWTIGIGSTYYDNGKKVKQGDTISLEMAYKLAETIVIDFILHVKKEVTKPINENQLIALISFCYNIGKGAFSKSMILKMVNKNPMDPAIRDMFEKSFVTAGGIPTAGLVNRRKSEAAQYFK